MGPSNLHREQVLYVMHNHVSTVAQIRVMFIPLVAIHELTLRWQYFPHSGNSANSTGIKVDQGYRLTQSQLYLQRIKAMTDYIWSWNIVAFCKPALSGVETWPQKETRRPALSLTWFGFRLHWGSHGGFWRDLGRGFGGEVKGVLQIKSCTGHGQHKCVEPLISVHCKWFHTAGWECSELGLEKQK